MGSSIVVDSSNFAAEVVEKSYEKAVLVDFFAQWCGPCQMLKPILERLTQEYDFVLAKVDIDQNPDLANAYGIQGVPDVRIVTQGQMIDGFVGVLSESGVRSLLARLNLKSALEDGLEAIRLAQLAGDVEQAKGLFAQLIEQYPQNRTLTLEAASFLMVQGQLDSAEKLLATIQEHEKEYFLQAQSIKGLLQLKREADKPMEDEMDKLFSKASRLTLAGDYETALQFFLEVVTKDPKQKREAARKAMLTVFGLLGDDHPLTRHYRKQLRSNM